MRKRSGGGGGGKSVSQSMVNLLLRDLESIENRSSNGVHEIMLTLRTNFRHRPYSRLTDSALTRLVQKSLNILPRRASLVKKQGKVTSLMVQSDSDDEGDGGQGTPSCKKMKRVVDKSEERLQLIEEAHIHRMRRNHYQGHSSLSSPSPSPSPSSEEDSEESDDEKDGAVSTSENAIYGEKFEPEFDLTKSMLRASYTKSTGSAKNKFLELKKEEKNIELEVSSRNKIELLSGGGGRRRLPNESKNEGKSLGSSSDIVEVKGKEGPWFRDMGGMKAVLDELIMDVIVPLYHPEIPSLLGVRPMAGILLHGPPGCGKTTLAHAIANETGVPFYKISATEIVSGVSGASEENIRELFLKAHKTAPSIVFIDEIDAIASKRENLQREMERRIVTQLMTCMDESCRLVKSTDANTKSEDSDHRPGYVLVIGATNRPDALDPALRRPGRLEREISLGVPDENARTHILSVLTHNLKLEGSLDLMKIARSTPGFVGADLDALANKAGNLAMKRIIDERKKKYMLSSESMIEEHVVEWWKEQWLPEEKENLAITMNDFEEAIKMVQPSSRREGFSAIPDVKWEDVGGLDPLRQEFDRYIVRRIKYPEEYEGFGVDLETGFLLYGPPGCGKTLIAKAVANEAGANFIHIKGPELLNKYVGESELAVRTLFTRARTCAPCILFFDEVDALTTKRGQEGGWVVERLLNQLLIELDGSDHRRGVYVIGATNRPEVMDRAVLRPGRFGKLIYVPLPNPNERGLILKALAKKKPIDASLDLTDIGRMEACENFSGADLSSLMNEAAMAALEEKLALAKSSSSDTFAGTIKSKHFELALTKMTPSVSGKQKQYYQKLSETFKAA